VIEVIQAVVEVVAVVVVVVAVVVPITILKAMHVSLLRSEHWTVDPR